MLEVPIYPKLARMSFENPRIGSRSIDCNVKGTLIVLDEGRFSCILEMPRTGICFSALEKKIDGLKVILERDDGRNLKNQKANLLSMEIRLLHNIVSLIFLSKI